MQVTDYKYVWKLAFGVAKCNGCMEPSLRYCSCLKQAEEMGEISVIKGGGKHLALRVELWQKLVSWMCYAVAG